MSAVRSARAVRSLTLVNTLLMMSAFTVPASAQIETVVVTAERKAENIQTVPVAVTALTGADLRAKQVTNFRDLQFHVPSVTQTKSDFGGAQFQIRGITTQFGLGAAISQNEDDIYLEAPALVTGEFFDVDRVEVARGPQSTSYGRAATGGSVNIITSKPDLDNFAARVTADYGTFNTIKPDAMLNVPIIDGVLGVRLAVHGDYHNGYEKNVYSQLGFPQVYPGTAPETRSNNLGVTSARFSVRWEPSDDTTVDLVADGSYENDRRVRGDKQLCHRDPSGVVGCLPDRLGFDALNANSTLGVTLGSAQGIAAAISNPLRAALGPAAGQAVAQYVGNTTGLCSIAGNGAAGDPAGPAGAAFLGLRGTGPAGAGGTVVPQTPEAVNGPCSGAGGVVTPNLLTTNTAFNPLFKTYGALYLLNVKQKVNDWLSATFDVGYNDSYQFTQQDYTDATPENISPEIKQAVNGFRTVFGLGSGNGGNPAPFTIADALFMQNGNAVGPGTYNSTYFNVPGELPLSNTNYLGPGFRNYGGIIDSNRGGILTKSPFNLAYDTDWFAQREITGELRFQTNLKGPLNFSAGAFWLSYDAHNQYWVAASGLDYEAIVLGAIANPCSLAKACATALTTPDTVLGTPDFDAEYRRNFVQDRSAFLEATYDIIPDELKFIAGARFNDDLEHLDRTTKCAGGGTFAVNAINPNQGKLANGTTPSVNSPCDGLATDANGNTDGTAGVTDLFPIGSPNVNLPVTTRSPTFLTGEKNDVTDLWTGRASLNWTPKLDFTNQTLVYFTASRGELAGGVNTPNNGATSIAPTVFKPSTVDALELGTKNTLLDNTLTANLDIWYYNYENYQVGIIANRQALTLDVPANLYGFEGEFLWQPTDALTFNATLSLTHSATGHVFLTDERNPTEGQHGAIFVKDLTNGSNCVVTVAPGNPKGLNPQANSGAGPTPGDSAAYHVANFFLPNGGNASIDAPFGVPLVNYGVCGGPGSQAQADLEAAGFEYSAAINPQTGKALTQNGKTVFDGTGIAHDLHGSSLPQVPFGQVGVGAQYAFKLPAEYSLVPRVDYYWQSSMEARVWNDPVIDRINAWDVMNAQVQLNSPSFWYAQVFVKNVFDKQNPTGEYLSDPTSALFTNVFVEDPRLVGVELGAHW